MKEKQIKLLGGVLGFSIPLYFAVLNAGTNVTWLLFNPLYVGMHIVSIPFFSLCPTETCINYGFTVTLFGSWALLGSLVAEIVLLVVKKSELIH